MIYLDWVYLDWVDLDLGDEAGKRGYVAVRSGTGVVNLSPLFCFFGMQGVLRNKMSGLECCCLQDVMGRIDSETNSWLPSNYLPTYLPSYPVDIAHVSALFCAETKS